MSDFLGAGLQIGLSQTGDSSSSYSNTADSWGSSSSHAWSNADSVADSWGFSDSYAENSSESSNQNITYGREATAKDIELAREQNALQRSLWNEQAEYNAKQAAEDRAWQERMSNTAYQRAVKDLLAAGLNPILAVGNMGASTPVGAMASSGMASAYRANVQAQSEGYGSSASRGYSRSNAESGSHSESHAESDSRSSSSYGSHSEGSGSSNSHWGPIAESAINAVGGMVGDGVNAAKGIIDESKKVMDAVAEDRKNSGYSDHQGRASKDRMKDKLPTKPSTTKGHATSGSKRY